MIVVSKVPLSFRDKEDKLAQTVKKEIEKLKNSDDVVVIKDPRPILFTSEGKKELPPIISFSLRAMKMENGISEEWIYCDNPIVTESGNYQYKPKRVYFSGRKEFTTKDAELIYFLTKIMNLKSVGLVVEDKAKTAKEINDTFTVDGDVKYMIFSRHSPLSDDEKRQLALAWGYGDAESDNIEVVKNHLYNLVAEGEKNKEATKRGFDQFLDDAQNMGSMVRLRANINRSIKEKIIEWAPSRNRYLWSSTGQLIATVPGASVVAKEEFLVNHFLNHKGDSEILEVEIQGLGTLPILSEADVLSESNVQKLKKIAKDKYGKSFNVGATKDELQKFIISQIKETGLN